MRDIIFVILLSLSIEFLTVILRLIFHWRSESIQKKIHIPRTHHAYIGSMMVLFYIIELKFFDKEFPLIFLSIASSLIISDLIHHLFVLDIIKKYKYDIGMIHHKEVRRYAWDVLCYIMIFWGLFAFVTPFTPGSWLAIIGSVNLIGQEKTLSLTKKITGKKLFEFLRIEKIFKKF